MYLTLSGRILEASERRPSALEFVALAKEAGYDGVGLRGWQLPPENTQEDPADIKACLEDAGLCVSSITVPAAAVELTAPFARELNAKVLQVSGSVSELAGAAVHLDDDMRLGPQMHTGGEFETVALAAETLARIADPRVGVVVEPANHMFAGETWSEDLFKPIAERIIGCNLQSIEVGQGEQSLKLCDGSTRVYRRVPARENTQADFHGFFAALRAAGYDGYVNVIEPASKTGSIEFFARETADYMSELL